MPLIEKVLAMQIQAAFDNQSENEKTKPKEARKKMAEDIAKAIHSYVTSGIVSTTVVGSSASGGPVTGSGTGSIS